MTHQSKSVAQKRHERFLLECFLKAAQLEAEVVAEQEAPDFIIHFEGRKVGVEVTELHISSVRRNGPLKARESVAAAIVAKARAIYEEKGGRPAHVSVHFFPGQDIRKLRRDTTAKELAETVLMEDLTPWERRELRVDELEGLVPAQVSLINALGVPERSMAHWSTPAAGWVTPLSADAIQKRIDAKAPRLPEYTKSASENWLLIVADGTKPSGLFESVEPEAPLRVRSPFDRTYFYGHPERNLLELNA